jgi:hypothetical protein
MRNIFFYVKPSFYKEIPFFMPQKITNMEFYSDRSCSSQAPSPQKAGCIVMALVANHAKPGLFSILGTTYGGDGRTTFALPNLAAVNNTGEQAEIKYLICVEGVYPSRP